MPFNVKKFCQMIIRRNVNIVVIVVHDIVSDDIVIYTIGHVQENMFHDIAACMKIKLKTENNYGGNCLY